MLFAALVALIATSIAAGFAGWSRVRAATHMPLTGWSFVLPGLIVAGGFLLSDFIVSWLFYHGPRIVAVRLLGALLFDVAPIVGLGILAGALSYSALRRPVPAQPQQPPPGTGAAP